MATVDFEALLTDQHEQVGQGARGLGFAQHQITAVAQGEGEAVQDVSLQLGREIDQRVATEHEVDVRKRRALPQVVLPKDYQATDALGHLITIILS